MANKLLAVIVKGNPKLINNDTARNYYQEIEAYLKKSGVDNVEYDSGADYTIPRLDADLYVAHSRGTSREQYLPKDKKKVFLKFGVSDGVSHPVDAKWNNEVWKKGRDDVPPKEHFLFIPEQKRAITELVKQLQAKKDMNKYIQKVAEIMSDENQHVAKTFAIQTAASIPAHMIGAGAGAALAGEHLARPAAALNAGITGLSSKLQGLGRTGSWLAHKMPVAAIGSRSLGAMAGMAAVGGVADLMALKHGFHGKVNRNE